MCAQYLVDPAKKDFIKTVKRKTFFDKEIFHKFLELKHEDPEQQSKVQKIPVPWKVADYVPRMFASRMEERA